MKTIIDRTIQRVRVFNNKLRPDVLDSFGLLEALETYFSEFSQLYNLECNFIKPDEEFDVDLDKSIAIYRIVQEALTNVARHASATEVNITIDQKNNKLFLSVQDNGIGMEEKQRNDMKKFGITGMNERAYIIGGDLQITSEPRKGTKINLTIPL